MNSLKSDLGFACLAGWVLVESIDISKRMHSKPIDTPTTWQTCSKAGSKQFARSVWRLSTLQNYSCQLGRFPRQVQKLSPSPRGQKAIQILANWNKISDFSCKRIMQNICFLHGIYLQNCYFPLRKMLFFERSHFNHSMFFLEWIKTEEARSRIHKSIYIYKIKVLSVHWSKSRQILVAHVASKVMNENTLNKIPVWLSVCKFSAKSCSRFT